MRQRIAVAIHPGLSYSAQVLGQLGIAWVPVKSVEEGVAQGVRVFLWSGAYDKGGVDSASGAPVAVISDNGSVCSGAPVGCETARRSYFFQMADKSPFAGRSFYANLPISQTEGESFGACYDRDNNEIPNSGIGISESDDRLIVSLPWAVSSYERGAEWEHCPYFSSTANKHFVEVGPTLDTGAFRRLLLEILVYCFNWVGLPLVRVSPFYKNKRYFSFLR